MMKMSEIWKWKANELYGKEEKRYKDSGKISAKTVEKISLLHIAEHRCKEYEDENTTNR